VADHIKFPASPSSEASEGERRFDEFEKYLFFNWSTTLARPNMWYVLIQDIPFGLELMNDQNIVNREGPNQYTQLDENQLNLFNAMKERVGCMLIHGVTLPELSNDASREAPRMGGYYGGLLSNLVSEQAQFTLEFRETQSSVVDFVIRPWIELVSRSGLIARKRGDERNVKCKITIVKLGIAGAGTDPIRRKIWEFYNVVPTSVANHRLTHEGTWSATDMYMPTNWTYSHYDVTDVTFDNVSELYKSHIQSDAMPPGSAAKFADRVGAQGAPAAPWSQNI